MMVWACAATSPRSWLRTSSSCESPRSDRTTAMPSWLLGVGRPSAIGSPVHPYDLYSKPSGSASSGRPVVPSSTGAIGPYGDGADTICLPVAAIALRLASAPNEPSNPWAAAMPADPCSKRRREVENDNGFIETFVNGKEARMLGVERDGEMTALSAPRTKKNVGAGAPTSFVVARVALRRRSTAT